jgi:hypothetical protein
MPDAEMVMVGWPVGAGVLTGAGVGVVGAAPGPPPEQAVDSVSVEIAKVFRSTASTFDAGGAAGLEGLS